MFVKIGRSTVAFAVLSLCLAPLLAQEDSPASSGCSLPVVAHTDPAPPQTAKTMLDHMVFVQVKFDRSGRVRGVKALSGPSRLRSAALKAVKKKRTTGLRPTVEMFVQFAEDDSTIKQISEMSPGGGAMSCVTVVAPTRVRVSREAMAGRLVKRIEPVHPPEAREKQIQGAVILNLSVDERGKVSRAVKFSGPDLLVPAAIEAVKQWEYQPFMLDGSPIKVETTVIVNFTQ